MKTQTSSLVKLYLDEHAKIAGSFPVHDVVLLVTWIKDVYDVCGAVYTFGNGGGASIADHFASDLAIHPFVSEDKRQCSDEELRLDVHCLNNSSGLMTRIANDIGYDNLFVEQLKQWEICPSDLVIAFSTSGNSPNIVKALDYASRQGAKTVLVGGRNGGMARGMVDLPILVPGTSQFPGQTGANDNNFHIEDFQGSIAHMVTGLMREYVNERD